MFLNIPIITYSMNEIYFEYINITHSMNEMYFEYINITHSMNEYTNNILFSK